MADAGISHRSHFSTGVASEQFFTSQRGGDEWISAEREAGRRRRMFEVAGAQVALMVVLIVAVVVIGYGRVVTGHLARGSVSHSQSQGLADWTALNGRCPAHPATPLSRPKYQTPALSIQPGLTYIATVATTVGTFRIELDPTVAPFSVNSFVFLADVGYFNCNIFQRVVPGSIDLTGNPVGTGLSFPGYLTKVERPPLAAEPDDQYPIGSVALANSGLYDAGGSEWFVVAGAQGASLPNDYSLIGHVISGLNVVDQINEEGSISGAPIVTQRVLTVQVVSERG
jgi:peptidylprolyl isomerase/peptidyl-prolyl cis-trans isomerase B (cyclophilin B)